MIDPQTKKHAIKLMAQGQSPTKVALRLHLCIRSCHRWKKGSENDKRPVGRPKRLLVEAKRRLLQELLRRDFSESSQENELWSWQSVKVGLPVVHVARQTILRLLGDINI